MKANEIVKEIMAEIEDEQAEMAREIIKERLLEVQYLEIALGKAKKQLELLLEKDIIDVITM